MIFVKNMDYQKEKDNEADDNGGEVDGMHDVEYILNSFVVHDVGTADLLGHHRALADGFGVGDANCC